MNAAEARAQATARSTIVNTAGYNKVKNAITNAVAQGKLSTTYDGDITAVIQQLLKEEGYKLNWVEYRNEGHWDIAW